jgi:iron-sulfur cluster repair protein YtfE (RIC family)
MLNLSTPYSGISIFVAKRDPSLISLSHDHHHSLALAVRLKQGDKALLSDGWTHDRRAQVQRVEQFYNEELRLHFKIEEQVLFPMMRSALPQWSELPDALVQQHRQLEQMIAALPSVNGESLSRALVDIGELLELHVRLEDRQLFPLFESDIPDDMRIEVGKHIATLHAENKH